MRGKSPGLRVTPLLSLLLVASPLVAQEAQVAASAPEGATVHTITVADLKDAICANRMEADLEVPAGQWIAWPIGWMAVDEATARANWESMAFEFAVDDQAVAVPDELEWRAEPVTIECPAQTMKGTMVAPVVFLPPASAPRTFALTYRFKNDVNDGWSTYAKDSSATFVARLRLRS